MEDVPRLHFPDDACGPGSLATILAFYGVPVALEAVAAELPEARGGRTLSTDLLVEARRYGLEAKWVVGSTEDLESLVGAGEPALVLFEILDLPGRRRDLYHYAVVDGMAPEEGLVRLLLGDGGASWGRMREFDKAWEGAGRALLEVRAPASDDLSADALVHRGLALERSARADAAIAAYRLAADRDPARARVWINLGNVLAAQSRDREAEEAYGRALAIDGGSVEALNNLAWLLHSEGRRPGDAEILARRAVAAAAAGPLSPDALDTLGRILLDEGRCAEAEEVLRRSLAAAREQGRKPDDPAGREALRSARRCAGA